ncbi:MAG: DUF3106 domain-containing protein [Rubrivivax sp.]
MSGGVWRTRAWALPVLMACVCAYATGALAAPVDQPPTWASLSSEQKRALAPLQQEWAGVDTQRKEKWIEVASRFATLSPDERQRVQTRMTEWLRLSPSERNRARLQFQEVKQVPADERQARWQAYQALTPEERKRLASEARPAAKAAAVDPRAAVGATAAARLPTKQALPGANGAAASAASRNAVAAPPGVLQARPGATTHTSTALPTPPLHHQAGMPKISATPGFVDPNTMLPQRGPQGAAVRSVAPRPLTAARTPVADKLPDAAKATAAASAPGERNEPLARP